MLPNLLPKGLSRSNFTTFLPKLVEPLCRLRLHRRYGECDEYAAGFAPSCRSLNDSQRTGDIETLKSAYAKLAPADDPPPTPPIRVKPLGLTPSQRR